MQLQIKHTDRLGGFFWRGLWLGCLEQETCELWRGLADVHAQIHTHTHIMQAGWKLFLDTQDLALADGMSQGIKLYINTLRTQNKARDFLKEKLVQTIMQALLIQWANSITLHCLLHFPGRDPGPRQDYDLLHHTHVESSVWTFDLLVLGNRTYGSGQMASYNITQGEGLLRMYS